MPPRVRSCLQPNDEMSSRVDDKLATGKGLRQLNQLSKSLSVDVCSNSVVLQASVLTDSDGSLTTHRARPYGCALLWELGA